MKNVWTDTGVIQTQEPNIDLDRFDIQQRKKPT